VGTTPTTSYGLASLGKSITATAVMTLAERGRVDLDAPVESYFDPSARLTAYEGRAVDATLRSVLNMTSSIPHGELVFRSRADFDAYTSADLVRHRGLLVFPPGETYVYSNFAYGVLEHVIEHVSGMPYSTFMAREVFEPLGMRQSLLFADAPVPGVRLATKYDAPGRVSEEAFAVPQSSLGMHASLEDLLRYARFHLKASAPDQRRILSDRWLDAMHRERPELATVDSLVALGWGSIDLEGTLWLLSNGRARGAQSALSLIPSEGLAVVCLTNITGNDADETAFRITDALVPGFLERFGRRRASWEAQTAPPYEPKRELLGEWRGAIRTAAGETKVTLEFQQDGDVHVKLEGQHEVLLNAVRYEDGLLTGEFLGQCPVERPVAHPHEIQLGLRLRNGRLSGYAKSISSSDAGRFGLPAYISLTRR
jgi:CubicO group peptidase (beta-lactamase class C family)